MDGIEITGKSLGCDGEFASAAEVERHEAKSGHGADAELTESYSAELRVGHGDADVLDVVWRGIAVGLLVREGDA